MKSVYAAAQRLKMDRAARECVRFLATNINLETCLEVRASLSGITGEADLVKAVDEFIDANMNQLQMGRALMGLPRICVEVLHGSKDEMEAAQAR